MTQVHTNHHWRDFSHREDVPPEVLADQFDWTDEEDTDGFFCYKGIWYHTSQFIRFGYPKGASPPEVFNGWHGSLNDSFFSGVVIALNEEGQFKVGTFY